MNASLPQVTPESKAVPLPPVCTVSKAHLATLNAPAFPVLQVSPAPPDPRVPRASPDPKITSHPRASLVPQVSHATAASPASTDPRNPAASVAKLELL